MFGLQGPEGYAYISRSNCLEVEGIDDVADWAETLVSSTMFFVFVQVMLTMTKRRKP
jgi:myosin heavy subunit